MIQSQNSSNSFSDSPLIYYATFFLFFGIIYVINFIRPIFNLYTIYFDLNWAKFQILELFDVINIIFGGFLILFGFFLFIYKKFSRSLLIFGGILFFLFNLLDPSHFLMFWELISIIIGAPPVWMQVIPKNLLVVYISSWSLLSISNLILQCIGFYVAIRIIFNSNPQKQITRFLFFYCWVISLSGIILCLQSALILGITASWSSITIVPFILHFSIWIFMGLVGISGIYMIRNLLKHQVNTHNIIYGQISLISFSVVRVLIEFNDFSMKTIPILLFNLGFALFLTIFAFKLPLYLKEAKK